jgi:hypothetical protein
LSSDQLTPPPSKDRESIGLTVESIATVERLVDDLEWFAESQDAARLALAYAIRAGVAEGTASSTETRWSAGLFDRTGELRATVLGLYPTCGTPVRQMEFLVNEGLRLIAERLLDETVTPADLVG